VASSTSAAESNGTNASTLPTRDRRTPEFPVAALDRYSGVHVGDTAVRKWVKAAERLAGIPEVKGRAWYGARRAGVDLGKKEKISREGLQELGGWTDSQVPDSIYADQERDYAREEAAAVRARFRGESDARVSTNDRGPESSASAHTTVSDRARTDVEGAEEEDA
jgi:hypothetical protein